MSLHISLKDLLKLAGFDLGKPLQVLAKLLPLLPTDKLQGDIAHALQNNVTPVRRAELVRELRDTAGSLEKGDFDGAAATIVAILEGVQP